jgi:hypothetical protein
VHALRLVWQSFGFRPKKRTRLYRGTHLLDADFRRRWLSLSR